MHKKFVEVVEGPREVVVETKLLNRLPVAVEARLVVVGDRCGIPGLLVAVAVEDC